MVEKRFHEFAKLFADVSARQNTVERDSIPTRKQLLAEKSRREEKPKQRGKRGKTDLSTGAQGDVVRSPNLASKTGSSKLARTREKDQRTKNGKRFSQPPVPKVTCSGNPNRSNSIVTHGVS